MQSLIVTRWSPILRLHVVSHSPARKSHGDILNQVRLFPSTQTQFLFHRSLFLIPRNTTYVVKFNISTVMKEKALQLKRMSVLQNQCWKFSSCSWSCMSYDTPYGYDLFQLYDSKVMRPLYRHGEPWWFQKVEAPRVQHNWHMKVIRLSILLTGRLYPPRKYSWYSLLLKADSTPGPQCPVAYPGIFFGGGFNKFSWGQRGRGSGGGSPLVRGSGGSCNLVQ